MRRERFMDELTPDERELFLEPRPLNAPDDSPPQTPDRPGRPEKEIQLMDRTVAVGEGVPKSSAVGTLAVLMCLAIAVRASAHLLSAASELVSAEVAMRKMLAADRLSAKEVVGSNASTDDDMPSNLLSALIPDAQPSHTNATGRKRRRPSALMPPHTALLQLQLDGEVTDRTNVPYYNAGLSRDASPLSLAAAAASGEPLVRSSYAADPCARVFDGELWVYVSHDRSEVRETRVVVGGGGGGGGGGATTLVTSMSIADYHVFSTRGSHAPLQHRGVAMRATDVPWALHPLVWAPDVVRRPSDGRYVLYFPAIDKDGLWRIGAAVASRPSGPFVPAASPIQGSRSIDPHAHIDPSTGAACLFFGGLWGGQLERWSSDATLDATVDATVDGTVGGPRQDEPRQAEPRERARGVLMARLTRELTHLASPPREVVILDARSGRPLEANDTTRRFFEAAWVVTKDDGERSGGERSGSGIDGSIGGSGGGIDGKSGNGGAVHYLIYSTGDTHHLVYATSNRSIEGPYTFRGEVLPPVLGWSTHGALVAFDREWWLLYHDSTLSGGDDARRNLKVARVHFGADGSLAVLWPSAVEAVAELRRLEDDKLAGRGDGVSGDAHARGGGAAGVQRRARGRAQSALQGQERRRRLQGRRGQRALVAEPN